MLLDEKAEEMEMFAMDDGALARGVMAMIPSLLGDKVTISRRESMVVSSSEVVMFEANVENVMLSGWSSGEVMVWKFLQSLAGGTGINLALLAETVGGQPDITKRLTALFAMSLDGSAK